MAPSVQIAPSILSADFLNLERDVRLLTESAQPPEWLHIDVMDGHFVPNLTIGPPFVRALKQITTVPLDVHLMIDNPAQQLPWYLNAGADLLTIHVEAACSSLPAPQPGNSVSLEALQECEAEKLANMLASIREAGALAGLSLNPGTPVGLLEPFYPLLDVVLLMSVHPGFGGQSFIAQSLERIKQVAVHATAHAAVAHTAAPHTAAPHTHTAAPHVAAHAKPLIEVDGGIDLHTAPQACAAGAELLVAGNAVYGASDPVAALGMLRLACQGR